MIAKRHKSGVAGQLGRYGLIGATAALILFAASCFSPAAFGRQQNSSSPGWSSSSSSQSASPETTKEEKEQEKAAAKAALERKVNEDVNVGTFYMHKGDYGAAISRFEEAAQLDPREPKARLLLGESYEKQHNWSAALKVYKAYLRDFPKADGAKKIHKKIAELSRKRD